MRVRPRRTRRTPLLRELVAETRVSPSQLVQPHFVHGSSTSEPISAMPGIARMGIESLLTRVEEDLEAGVRSLMLFGVHGAHEKDAHATAATDADGVVPEAVRRLRAAFGDELTLMTDVCLCGATDTGHCGLTGEGGTILNDESLPVLADMALAHARAGADVVAPSDMMDGRVAAIRDRLDAHGFTDTAILSYSTKFASGFYGPFREAADSSPASGDRRSYQMDARNGREAVRESLLDEAEGADFLMVKPALSYLDVIREITSATRLPVAAYNVSGEYGMVKAAAERGWIDERAVVTEILQSIVRAGARIVITYHAREALQKGWIR